MIKRAFKYALIVLGLALFLSAGGIAYKISNNDDIVIEKFSFSFNFPDFWRVNWEAEGVTAKKFPGLTPALAWGALDPIRLTLNASMPWQGGTVAVENASINLWKGSSITLPVRAKSVALNAIAQALAGAEAEASGTISGVVPITFMPDGTFFIGDGELTAESAGAIRLPESILPGEAGQTTIAREVLKNFHYAGLSLATHENGGKTSISLTITGNNPDLYGGRAVNLNVNLKGDVLDFIRQNVLYLTDPTATLQQDAP